MKVLILTKEYPPHVYGGAGVHVSYLARELARLVEVEVRCFGAQSEGEPHLTVQGSAAEGSVPDDAPRELRPALEAAALAVPLAASPGGAEVVHCHTWYSYPAGILSKLLHGLPLVLTTHSLEPLRPWKREQLGRGYDYSRWVEREAFALADAVVAVSSQSRREVVDLFGIDASRVVIIPNGIDTAEYRPDERTEALEHYGIVAGVPYVLFVGRVTRQKGLTHLLDAAAHLDEGVGLVLCAGAPDTPQLAAEMEARVAALQQQRDHVHWIRETVPRPRLVQLYSHAAVFCCPSVYEPFGIINLEAMACGTPVVASAVGGIPEVVEDGRTGVLVPFAAEVSSPSTPRDPEAFARDLAEALNRVAGSAELRRSMGLKARRRAEEHFSWRSVAVRTRDLYERLVGSPALEP
jgi:starch synthase